MTMRLLIFIFLDYKLEDKSLPLNLLYVEFSFVMVVPKYVNCYTPSMDSLTAFML
jgi:hypothetical protein